MRKMVFTAFFFAGFVLSAWAQQRVRFVLTIIGNTRFILMSTSRSLDSQTIISLYAERFKTEGLFGELKNKMGGFAYHFWTYSLDKRKKGGITGSTGRREKA